MATLLCAHAKAAFAMMGCDPAIEVAKHILAMIKRERLESLTGRDALRLVRGRYPTMVEVTPGLKILEERGFIFLTNPEQGGPGRPKSPTYSVNTKVMEDAAR